MPVDAGDFIRVTATLKDVNNSDIQNVYFFRNSGTGTVTNVAFMSAVETKLSTMYNYLSSVMPTTLTPYLIDADKVDFVSGEIAVLENIGSQPWAGWAGGTSTSDSLPQGIAGVINFPVFDSTVQSRKFLGPLTEGHQNAGLASSTLLTALSNFGTELLTGMLIGTEQFYPGILSTKGNAWRRLATSISNLILGYQRRRKQGVGS